MSKEKRNWQDIMIEHFQERMEPGLWVNFANDNGLEACGELCETILKLEHQLRIEVVPASEDVLTALYYAQKETDKAVGILKKAHKAIGSELIEYGSCDITGPIYSEIDEYLKELEDDS